LLSGFVAAAGGRSEGGCDGPGSGTVAAAGAGQHVQRPPSSWDYEALHVAGSRIAADLDGGVSPRTRVGVTSSHHGALDGVVTGWAHMHLRATPGRGL